MPISLDQYIEDLDGRKDLPWPAAPKIDAPKAKPHITRLPVKAVMWTVYGTLIAVPHGELLFEPPPGPLGDFVFENALEKTIKEFKMWNSMSRKPGKPSEYMGELYKKAVATLRLTGGGDAQAERVWEDIVKKLQQKEYTYDVGAYGGLEEYTRKIAYFFHASLQGAGAYPGAADALRMVAEAGKTQGLLADGQSFTFGQLRRCVRKDDPTFEPGMFVRPELRVLSAEAKAKKPADALFKAAAAALAAKGVRPAETLHVGSSLPRDIGPAKKHGFRTALFAGDKNSLTASGEQLKDPALRPDVMLTELTQVIEVFA
ncbi:MAG TPA: HAD hydrolase-like protein [Urbifossiella sp.]|jgi:beta-phosphoglucomutase-like phosphatase (HAD superfamily)|nr:HAD hydrolase-like protein [Urbifossiella sp.]